MEKVAFQKSQQKQSQEPLTKSVVLRIETANFIEFYKIKTKQNLSILRGIIVRKFYVEILCGNFVRIYCADLLCGFIVRIYCAEILCGNFA